jgi:hypothetical protein
VLTLRCGFVAISLRFDRAAITLGLRCVRALFELRLRHDCAVFVLLLSCDYAASALRSCFALRCVCAAIELQLGHFCASLLCCVCDAFVFALLLRCVCVAFALLLLRLRCFCVAFALRLRCFSCVCVAITLRLGHFCASLLRCIYAAFTLRLRCVALSSFSPCLRSVCTAFVSLLYFVGVVTAQRYSAQLRCDYAALSIAQRLCCATQQLFCAYDCATLALALRCDFAFVCTHAAVVMALRL